MFPDGSNLLGVPGILEPRGPVRVPLYNTRPIQHSLYEDRTVQRHETPREKWRHSEREPTLKTTANTMGPRLMFTLISMVPMSLEDKSRRVRERGSQASGSMAEVETTRYKEEGGSAMDLRVGTGIKGGEYEDFLPRYTSHQMREDSGRARQVRQHC